MNKDTSTQPSTQAFLPVKEIKNGIVVLKNGTLRTVILVRTSGFELKSANEQNAIVASFEGFINSLNFPLQIVMQSRKVDLSAYLERLKNLAAEQKSELLRLQTENYLEFVQELITHYNIMSKSFYVVVPHNPGGIAKVGFLSTLLGKATTAPIVNFEKEKVALLEKTNLVISGLQSIGLRAIQLNTQELIELFYKIYNPETSQNQKISNLEEIISPMVTAAPSPKSEK